MLGPHITEINWKIAPIGWRREVAFYAALCPSCAVPGMCLKNGRTLLAKSGGSERTAYLAGIGFGP
jgi:hypothetical protein